MDFRTIFENRYACKRNLFEFLSTHIEDSIYFNPIITFLCAVNTILRYISAVQIRGIINHAGTIIEDFLSLLYFYFLYHKSF